MKTRSILVSFAGYPYAPNSLMPDNGLANLAGALLAAGHETRLLDFGTVDTIRRLYPAALSRKAGPICRRIFERLSQKRRVAWLDVLRFTALNRKLERVQRRELAGICEAIAREVKSFRPQFVGFKLWNGDGFTGSVRLAENLKRTFPRLKVYAGGPHADIFRETIFKVTRAFDALACGEGEETIIGLAEHAAGLCDLSSIPNIIYMEDGRPKANPAEWIQDLDTLPMPCYDEAVYPAMKGDQKIKIIVLDESRGCGVGCHFCIHPIKSGKRFKAKQPERIVEEMERCRTRYGVRVFRLAGSGSAFKHQRRVAQQIMASKLDVEYSTFGCFGPIEENTLGDLRESGCCSIFYGLESGSPEILEKSFGKKISLDHAQQVLLKTKKAGIFAVASVIHPPPFDTPETRKQTLDLLLRVRPDSVLVQFPGVFPQTEWGRNPRKYNFSLDVRRYAERVVDYKFKTLLPPRMWKPLPYRVNGMGFRAVIGETERLIKELEANDVLTAVSDDLALIARNAGFRGRERDFRDKARVMFLSGDADAIGETVIKINHRQVDTR